MIRAGAPAPQPRGDMNPSQTPPLVFTKEFTRQEPIPEEGIARALELMRSGRLHRYNTAAGEPSDVALLEKEYADDVGAAYCAAFSSCGSALYVALKSVGVTPGDSVLCNAFTLAPVPGAIVNAGGKVVLVDITPDLIIDLDDLERKAASSGARFLMLSHMRGHIADMDRVVEICGRNGLCLIEDCAHTVGCRWRERATGTFGTVGCYSTQTYKHLNSGEGGLLVTDDKEVIARAILYSGSYMLYETHVARPPMAVFERYKKQIPNFSLRMTNLAAAMIRPQLRRLDEQARRWNRRYALLEDLLATIPQVRLPRRPPEEHYVGSSIQFTLPTVDRTQIREFLSLCAERGVEIKWFGGAEPVGFTSAFDSWTYLEEMPTLPRTKAILDVMCDFRIPLTFSLDDCELIGKIIRAVAGEVF